MSSSGTADVSMRAPHGEPSLVRLPVPLLFRQMPISSGKQREPTSTEIAAQTAYPQVRRPAP